MRSKQTEITKEQSVWLRLQQRSDSFRPAPLPLEKEMLPMTNGGLHTMVSFLGQEEERLVLFVDNKNLEHLAMVSWTVEKPKEGLLLKVPPLYSSQQAPRDILQHVAEVLKLQHYLEEDRSEAIAQEMAEEDAHGVERPRPPLE